MLYQIATTVLNGLDFGVPLSQSLRVLSLKVQTDIEEIPIIIMKMKKLKKDLCQTKLFVFFVH